jgi:hypothetical protein
MFNVRKSLDARLAGKPCSHLHADQPERDGGRSTGGRVRGRERGHRPHRPDRETPWYQATRSIQRYVILEQKSIGAAVFARREGDWIATALTEENTLAMPEMGIEVPLIEFYAGLEFTEPTDQGRTDGPGGCAAASSTQVSATARPRTPMPLANFAAYDSW